jgi:hypothetical protein
MLPQHAVDGGVDVISSCGVMSSLAAGYRLEVHGGHLAKCINKNVS